MFSGEEMTCICCAFTQQSDPLINSGWTSLIIGDETRYICPKCSAAPWETDSTKCETCNQYYDSDYEACPHCLKAEKKERFKSFIIEALDDAQTEGRLPMLVVEEDFVNDAVSIIEELKDEFEKRGFYPIFQVRTSNSDKDAIGCFVIQVLVAARMLSHKTKKSTKDITKMLIQTARGMADEFTTEQLCQILDEYTQAIDEIDGSESVVNQNLN